MLVKQVGPGECAAAQMVSVLCWEPPCPSELLCKLVVFDKKVVIGGRRVFILGRLGVRFVQSKEISSRFAYEVLIAVITHQRSTSEYGIISSR
jgi:hypothetical protein